MPDPVTIGHLLMAAGLLAGLWALVSLATMLRHRGYGRGTPQYARARDARRAAVYAALIGAALYVVGCYTPLADIALAGGSA